MSAINPSSIITWDKEFQRAVAVAWCSANDPTTPPEHLRRVATEIWPDFGGIASNHPRAAAALERVIEAIVAHPNTPPDAIAEFVANTVPGAVSGLLRNPVFPLLALECPDFVARLPDHAAENILLRADIPPLLLRLLTGHDRPSIAWEARTHIGLAGEVPQGESWQALLESDLRALAEAVSDAETRCLHYELVRYGIAPSWLAPDGDPLNDPAVIREFTGSLTAVPPEVLAAVKRNPRLVLVHNSACRLPEIVASWLATPPPGSPNLHLWRYPENWNALWWALLTDPTTPRCLVERIHQLSWVRVAALRHPKARHRIVRPFERAARIEIQCNPIGRDLTLAHYLLAIRERPRPPLQEAEKWCGIVESPNVRYGHALYRLAAAMRLSPWFASHRRLLVQMKDNPNRYVRAAVRERLRGR